MNPEQSAPRALAKCRRCGSDTASPFSSAGGVCLRCAGERAFALGSDAPFESAAHSVEDGIGPAVLESDADLPARIGPYEIIEELGRGGMGRVFAARQRGLGRIVALKVLNGGSAATVELEMRFLREAQTVARLRHPHIVAIHDSGRAGGQAYFSMDYIAGGDLAQRLRDGTFMPGDAATLMAKVADALAHAHAEGVLHRDLKPSNILLDGDEPRLADFGLAAQLEQSSDFTKSSGVFGTPHYLAPEALRDGAAALTTVSDVYALGVVLYALLTGRTPFAGASPMALATLVNENDPPAPRLLAPAVPRDLETICLKCLEREPARRYPTAVELAADLRRFAAGEPIAAQPPGRWEHFQRFARRHRGGLIVAGVIVTLLTVAAVGGTSLAVRARRAEKLAATEAATARAVSDFLQNDLLGQASPLSQPDRDLKLRSVLDRASRAIEGRFAEEPLVEAAIRETLASTYASLGERTSELPHLQRALALLRRHAGPRDGGTLRVASQLATCQAFLGSLAQGIALGEATLATTRATLGREHPQTIRTMLDLVFVYRVADRLPAAETLAQETLATSRRVLGPDAKDHCLAMIFLASVYWAERKLPEAEKLGLESIVTARRVFGHEHMDTLTAMHNLASVYWTEGKLAEAERLGLETLELRQKVLGPEAAETARTMNNLATTYVDQGKFTEAVALHQQTLAIRRRLLGPEHPDTLAAMMNLAMSYLRNGELADADALLTPAVDAFRRVLGNEHTHTITGLHNLGELRRQQHRYDEAERLLREALEHRRTVFGPNNALTLSTVDVLASTLLGAGRVTEAETLLRTSLAARDKTTPGNWRNEITRLRLATALIREGQREAANSALERCGDFYRTRLGEVPRGLRFTVAESARQIAGVLADRGETVLAQQWETAAAETAR